MEELTELLLAFRDIPVTNETLLFAFIVVVGILGCKFFDDRKQRKYYDDMKAEKNKEIERLADDNRRYRDVYLKSIGMTQEQVDVASAAQVKGN